MCRHYYIIPAFVMDMTLIKINSSVECLKI